MLDTLFLFVLFMVALGLGWAIAHWQFRKGAQRESKLSRRYLKGLNYLLNEEPDKAIEIFLQITERKNTGFGKISRQGQLDVIDTHLALGSLFRRRGEMDKAIRFHKHIIAQPHLTQTQRTAALRELGRDYLQAGLLDRAERIFSELIERDDQGSQPAHQLMQIYQQEKEWGKAIEQAQQLKGAELADRDTLLAQFYCELAEQARAHGDLDAAAKSLRQARRYQPNHPRASLIAGDLAWGQGDLATAASEYCAACDMDPESFVLIDQRLLDAHEQMGQVQELREWLEQFTVTTPIAPAIIMLARLRARGDAHAGVETLLQGLEKRPTIRGLEALIDLLHAHDMTLSEVNPEIIGELMGRLRSAQPRYRCKECGFSSSEHHWLCPSCRQWDTTRLVQGPAGD